MEEAPSTYGKGEKEEEEVVWSALQTASYDEWPPIDERLLERCEGEVQQNLSSVLNDPSGQFQPENLYNAADLNIAPIKGWPAVDDASFEEYLAPMREDWEAFERNLEQEARDNEAEEHVVDFMDPEAASRELGVPRIYLESDFDLSSPETFEAVSDGDGNVTANLMLQQKLSHFLDTVEMELVRQIALRSRSFFEALSQIRDLHVQVSSGVALLQQLRRNLGTLETQVVRHALLVPQLRRRHANMERLMRVLRDVHRLADVEQRIEALVNEVDYCGALTLIDEAKTALREKLEGVVAFQKLHSKLESRKVQIGKQASDSIVVAVSGVQFDQTSVERIVVPALLGLQRLQSVEETWRRLRDVLSSDIKEYVRSRCHSVLEPEGDDASVVTLPFHVTVDGDGANARPSPPSHPPARGLSNNDLLTTTEGMDVAVAIRNMDADAFNALLRDLFHACLLQLEKFKFMHSLLLLVLRQNATEEEEEGQAVGASAGDVAPDEAIIAGDEDAGAFSSLVRESERMQQECCEVAHERLVRVIKMRGDGIVRLPLAAFIDFFSAAAAFVASSEEVTGKQCFVLRGAMMSQAKAYLDRMHKSRMAIITEALERERWSAAQVSPQQQLEVERVKNRHVDVEEGGSTGDISGGEPRSAVLVNGEEWKVVSAALVLVRCLGEYMTFARTLPSLGTDVVGKCARLLSRWNRKSGRLVLGAEAMGGMAKLKSITAKHLALCSQSLGLIAELLPSVQAELRCALSDKEAVLLNEYDAIASEYGRHRQDILNKLVQIMNDTLGRYVSKLHGQVVEWGAFPDRTSDYMLGIVEKTQTLHRVLAKLLPQRTLDALFERIFTLYNSRLKETYLSLELPTRNSRHRLRHDIQHLVQQLGSLPGLTRGMDASLMEFWEEQFGAAQDQLDSRKNFDRAAVAAKLKNSTDAPPPSPPDNLDGEGQQEQQEAAAGDEASEALTAEDSVEGVEESARENAKVGDRSSDHGNSEPRTTGGDGEEEEEQRLRAASSIGKKAEKAVALFSQLTSNLKANINGEHAKK